jgi:hypothetical protein
MPRKADRRRALDWMDKKITSLRNDAIERDILSNHDSIQDEEDMHMMLIKKRMERSRYIFKKKTHKEKEIRSCRPSFYS